MKDYIDRKDVLMAKIGQELYSYKQDLIKNYSKEKIINNAYEINFKEQIKDILKDNNLTETEIKMLLKTDNILDDFYKNWLKSDVNIWEQLEENVNFKLEQMTEDYEKKFRKMRSKSNEEI